MRLGLQERRRVRAVFGLLLLWRRERINVQDSLWPVEVCIPGPQVRGTGGTLILDGAPAQDAGVTGASSLPIAVRLPEASAKEKAG